VGKDDATDDSQAKAWASVVPATRGIQPGERLEDSLTVGFGNAFAVVGDDQLGFAITAIHLDLYDLASMPLGIVQQIGQGANDLDVDGINGQSGSESEPYANPIRPLGDHPPDQLGQIHYFCRTRRARLKLRQEEQVGDDGLQPVNVSQSPLKQLVEVGLIRMQLSLFKLRTKACDGGAQLVGRVGRELPLLGESPVHASCGVHCLLQWAKGPRWRHGMIWSAFRKARGLTPAHDWPLDLYGRWSLTPSGCREGDVGMTGKTRVAILVRPAGSGICVDRLMYQRLRRVAHFTLAPDPFMWDDP
jgi:hypothetical protein